MVESARHWNLGDWNWSVVVDTSDDVRGAALTLLLDSEWAAGRLHTTR